MRSVNKLAAELGLPLELPDQAFAEAELDFKRTFVWVAKQSVELPDIVLYEKFPLQRHDPEQPVQPGQRLIGRVLGEQRHAISSLDVVQYGERLLVPAAAVWPEGVTLRLGEERKGSVKLAAA